MTTEDDFQAALDANSDDWQTRLVFADWLEERGDPRAAGYRALGVNRVQPGRWQDSKGRPRLLYHDGGAKQNGETPIEQGALPRDWLILAVPSEVNAKHPMVLDGHITGSWPRDELATRRQFEDFVAIAFAKLPLKRQAKLLAGTGTRA